MCDDADYFKESLIKEIHTFFEKPASEPEINQFDFIYRI